MYNFLEIKTLISVFSVDQRSLFRNLCFLVYFLLLGLFLILSTPFSLANPSLSQSKPTLNPPPQFQNCTQWRAPLPFGKASPTGVTLETAKAWKNFRFLREQERMNEAYDVDSVIKRYRIEQNWIHSQDSCLTPRDLIDLGRALFLRRFTRKEGFGSSLRPRTHRSKFQQGKQGGPDATACVDCHWKGGFAGGGDRVDNAYLFGDGVHIESQEPRNPLALWGSGWVELIAREMNEDLKAIRLKAQKDAQSQQKKVRLALKSKGTDFGWISAFPDGKLDTQEVDGVDHDLKIKPFGWRGVFSTLREFVIISLHKHFHLQAEELVASCPREVDCGKASTQDPDGDGVIREWTEGQITALVSFLATLEIPTIYIPQESTFQDPPFIGEIENVPAPEFTLRWQKGFHLFKEVGCTQCHQPFMSIQSHRYPLKAPSSSKTMWLDLDTWGNAPLPEKDPSGLYQVPVFSDFKRHKMGKRLQEKYPERGVPGDTYLTRRLWGYANSAPYLHRGQALTLDEVIYMHGGEGSEAEYVSEAYFELHGGQKASLRLFLKSLSRSPSIRVR